MNLGLDSGAPALGRAPTSVRNEMSCRKKSELFPALKHAAEADSARQPERSREGAAGEIASAGRNYPPDCTATRWSCIGERLARKKNADGGMKTICQAGRATV